ncbi:hypothetical protein DUNSADRAFT_7715 [Dunaliella salina]|uniref:Uncharacterized protein n=1 Tax=Dunaliella salina TaxID=3046 RepID=A0ABQ7GKV9_DUNSA|nr:hypothetical protein DUNSADRAFT_7715 [Dunaliella salina]|eukprot:KAF5835226.1 hypothetical protein DUNSADRAFT_7715 [Dunaliella salina]
MLLCSHAQCSAASQPIKRHYWLSLIGPREGAMYKWQQSLLAPSKQLPPVNMLRITGRPESEMQRVAPWGYGDGFDESKIPPKLAALVSRVRALPGLRLGPLRDITINYRHSGFLRLDPHIDPALDGENVFIIGVDSDTVLTLCPAARRELWRWLCTAWDAVLLR